MVFGQQDAHVMGGLLPVPVDLRLSRCALTPAILWFANRYRFERQLWRRHLLVHLAFMLFTVSIAKIAWDGTMPPTSLFHEFTWEKLFRSVESTFDTGPLLYAVGCCWNTLLFITSATNPVW